MTVRGVQFSYVATSDEPSLHDGESTMTQGNKNFGVGMVLGLAVGVLLYRLIFT